MKCPPPMGWETVENVLTPLASGDFSSYIAQVIGSGADVLNVQSVSDGSYQLERDAVHASTNVNLADGDDAAEERIGAALWRAIFPPSPTR